MGAGLEPQYPTLMTIANSFIRPFFAALILAFTACADTNLTDPGTSDRIASVGVAVDSHGYSSDVFLTLGDRDTVLAEATTGGWHTHTVYGPSEPRRFQFSSSNPAVATVDLDGVLTTLSVGATELHASAGGITSDVIRVAVSPPVTALVVTPASVSTHVGDTFTVSVAAVDANGQYVRDVIFNVSVDTTAWALTSLPAEGTWRLHTPGVLHFQAKAVGRVQLVITTQNERVESRFKALVPVVIEPR